jgi:type IV secretory pathway VirB3-like protein
MITELVLKHHFKLRTDGVLLYWWNGVIEVADLRPFNGKMVWIFRWAAIRDTPLWRAEIYQPMRLK